MGCVLFISIVQFSRINPLLQRSKIILPNLHFVVKHFFQFFQISFSVLCRFLISESYYIRVDSACQCFSSKTFAVNLPDILFFVPFRQAHLDIIHTFSRMSTSFFTFFHFLLNQRSPPLSIIYRRKYKTPTTSGRGLNSSIIMLSFLLQYQPVFFLPFWKHTAYKQHHL